MKEGRKGWLTRQANIATFHVFLFWFSIVEHNTVFLCQKVYFTLLDDCNRKLASATGCPRKHRYWESHEPVSIDGVSFNPLSCLRKKVEFMYLLRYTATCRLTRQILFITEMFFSFSGAVKRRRHEILLVNFHDIDFTNRL